MSSRAATTPPGGSHRAVQGARRAALRLAFGVTACFGVVEAFDWDVSFLAPLLAANMLVKLPRPPTLAQGAAIVALMALSTGAVLMLTAALIGNPAVLILALALVMYLSFYAHRRGAPDLATLLLQMSAVTLPVVSILAPHAADAFATMLVMASIVALLTVWLAHASFPAAEAATGEMPVAGTAVTADAAMAARQALLDTLALLPVLAWFVLDASTVAIVVLIVIVTLLRQHDPQQGQRAALGLILGNLIGGVAAAAVYELVVLGGTFLFFVMVCLAASLIFAGRIVTAGDRAPIYAIAFATFILLLGLSLAPLPASGGELFLNRLLNVLLASAYAIGGLSLVEPWRPSSLSGD